MFFISNRDELRGKFLRACESLLEALALDANAAYLRIMQSGRRLRPSTMLIFIITSRRACGSPRLLFLGSISLTVGGMISRLRRTEHIATPAEAAALGSGYIL
jgi:hypothetical protein